jgi:hypothetical protein
VQPYNTLLSMSSLAQLSSGILLLQNEALHATCSRLLGIKHPRLHVSACRQLINAACCAQQRVCCVPCAACPRCALAVNEPLLPLPRTSPPAGPQQRGSKGARQRPPALPQQAGGACQ